jgi:preprotein translocase subunit SecD
MPVSRPLSPRYRAESGNEAAVRVELRLAEIEPKEGLIEVIDPYSSKKIFLHKDPLITNQDIIEARVVENDLGEPEIVVTFSGSAEQKMREATDAHRGKPMAILIDGKVISAPTIRSRIGSSAAIDGKFSRQEAERIARGLASQD